MASLFMRLGRGTRLRSENALRTCSQIGGSCRFFYDGITPASRILLDNSVGESLHMKKTTEEALELIEMNKTMSQNINVITQHLGGMQVSIVNTQDASYDMSGGETKASIRNLEVQMGQLAKQVAEVAKKSTNSFSSNTVPNPREECKAIHLRSGKAVGREAQGSEEQVEEALEKAKDTEEHAPTSSSSNPNKAKEEQPKRLQKATKDKQFSKFLEVFRKLQINILFVEALEQIPLYAKFMKELLTKKRDLKENKIVVLTKECSTIIQKNLPQKMKDPGSFLISYTIGEVTIQRALCDLGASINLMSLSLMRKLQIDEVKPTRISLQLADHSIKFSLGVVENLLAKVKTFIFPADFVILDMEEDVNASIILERPFLAIRRALIDMQKCELTLRVNNEQIILNVFEALQHLSDSEDCMKTDLIEPLI
ncbi:uncharacterized protein LOC127744887 [Arachis duranensis]|uniref:Uncharacterized protein LOC127744887 n=1 Tax=Arachis duranensis TaxID=130453 RepID=A0A9C6WT91_ARADU|nr:uncharacterized protein LOC127744887 [Arachis duranensis]